MKSRSEKSKNPKLEVQIGPYLRQQRLHNGYSQSDVARVLGVCNMFVSNIECNKCAIPLGHLKKMILLYDLDKDQVIDYLLLTEKQRLELALDEGMP